MPIHLLKKVPYNEKTYCLPVKSPNRSSVITSPLLLGSSSSDTTRSSQEFILRPRKLHIGKRSAQIDRNLVRLGRERRQRRALRKQKEKQEAKKTDEHTVKKESIRQFVAVTADKENKPEKKRKPSPSEHDSANKRVKPPPLFLRTNTPDSSSTRTSRFSNGTEHSLVSLKPRYPEEATFQERMHQRGTLVNTYGSPCLGCGMDFCQHMKQLKTVKNAALRYFGVRIHDHNERELCNNSLRRNWFYTCFKQHIALTSVKKMPSCVVDFCFEWFPPSVHDLNPLRLGLPPTNPDLVAGDGELNPKYCADSLLQLKKSNANATVRSL